jgi:hypothetical protein
VFDRNEFASWEKKILNTTAGHYQENNERMHLHTRYATYKKGVARQECYFGETFSISDLPKR